MGRTRRAAGIAVVIVVVGAALAACSHGAPHRAMPVVAVGRDQASATTGRATPAVPAAPAAASATAPVPYAAPTGHDYVPGPTGDPAYEGIENPGSCSTSLKGQLAFTRQGGRYVGRLSLSAATGDCETRARVTVTLLGPGGAVVGTGSPPAPPAANPPTYDELALSYKVNPPAIAEVDLPAAGCVPSATKARVDDGPAAGIDSGSSGTVTVTGLPATSTCTAPATLAVTPVGSGYVPVEVPERQTRLRVRLTIGGQPDLQTQPALPLVLTVSNPTAAAIPLSPCPGYNILISGNGMSGGTVGGVLNCAAAPPAIPAGGAVSFVIAPPNPAVNDGFVYTAAIAGVPSSTVTG